MQKYVVTRQNKQMVAGLLRKFVKSCRMKRHCFTYNRELVIPAISLKEACTYSFKMPIVTGIQMNVRMGGGCC